MKYISTLYPETKADLLNLGYKLLTERKTVSGQTIWVFCNKDADMVCFDKDGDKHLKQKCVISDELIMSF